jgi:hypothetical protein
MDRDHPVSARGRFPILIGVALLSALAGWLLFGRRQPVEPETTVAVVAEPGPPPAAEPAPPPPWPVAPPPAAHVAHATEAEGELPHPHPITPEHLRIQLENQFIQAMNDAMDLRDGAKLRKLASQYREHHFEDVDKMGEGYDVVANCLLYPGPESKAAAQSFFDRERASILRRHVKRHCLD